MKTAFLRSAREEDVLCTASVLKPGHRSASTARPSAGVLTSGLLAHHVLTYAKAEASGGRHRPVGLSLQPL
jgi:acyl-coenzyme A thioesterase PaaI-like protein